MKDKKILILTMCCNQELFQQQEYRLRTQLYAKDILENKYNNVDYWTYTASADGKYHVNKKLHKIEVPCDDSLYGTYDKTYKAFKLLNQLNIEYDYILRTNCSTYINIPLLKLFVNKLNDQKLIYSNSIYCSKDGCAPYQWSLYGLGNSLLLSKFWVSIITKNNINNLKKFNYNKLSTDSVYTVDDNAIGFTVNCFCLQNNWDICDIWKSWKVPLQNKIPVEPYKYICIPFREYRTRDNEIKNSLYIHDEITNYKDGYTDEYVNSLSDNMWFHILDFEQGMHSIVDRKLGELFMDFVYVPRYVERIKEQENKVKK